MVSPTLDPATISLLTGRLSDAETALHQLMLGQTPNEVRDQNGESVKYNLLSAVKLRAYIYELRVRLQIIQPQTMRVWIAPDSQLGSTVPPVNPGWPMP